VIFRIGFEQPQKPTLSILVFQRMQTPLLIQVSPF